MGFLNNLRDEMAKSIPVKPDCIQPINRYQWDPDLKTWQMLFKFDVFANGGSNDNRSATQLINTLNTLIRNKDVTLISRLYHTNFLDENYGFVLKREIFF